MRVLVTIFIYLHVNGYAQEKGLHNQDDTLVYQWGKGHISLTLWLFEQDNSFQYVYRDDGWTNVSSGTYIIEGDQVLLSCISNCDLNTDSNSVVLNPIVVESYKEMVRGENFVVISTSEDTLTDYIVKIVTDSIIDDSQHYGRHIQICNKNGITYDFQIKKNQTNYFTIYIPFSIEHSGIVAFSNKQVTLIGDYAYFDDVKMKKIRLRFTDDNLQKKNRKRK